ncbi:MAG: hypothetical protein ABA06_03920 [Parcubacteria bacterium C7867-001]|nr:MAG: hypothetical protein ABA06_03920 [Parcubacteria bacterium C7867-001]
MSTTGKIIVAIIIIALIGLGIYYWTTNGAKAPSDSSQATQTSETSPKDATDDALLKDSAAIDLQINGFASDNAAVESGLNDQPISQ